ncbi:MAG: hypothetical protein FJZ90_09575 [Chloroflexi bacterium]|nr:hypothetical protein [Chloroflexota bacterium]
MWLIAEYEPTTLYSLKPASATSSGGKTLLAPTPFALKMALLDVVFRSAGAMQAEARWPLIRDLTVAVQLPHHAVVTQLFTRILKPSRSAKGLLDRSIGYREYVHFSGPWALAFSPGSEELPPWFYETATCLHYLGKRGDFVQLTQMPQVQAELPGGFVQLNPPEGQAVFDIRGTLQLLDDCGPRMTFAHADIYSGTAVGLGRERILRPVVLPYRVTRTSKSYTLYEHLNSES